MKQFSPPLLEQTNIFELITVSISPKKKPMRQLHSLCGYFSFLMRWDANNRIDIQISIYSHGNIPPR